MKQTKCLFDENWMTPKGVISESSQNSNTNRIKAEVSDNA